MHIYIYTYPYKQPGHMLQACGLGSSYQEGVRARRAWGVRVIYERACQCAGVVSERHILLSSSAEREGNSFKGFIFVYSIILGDIRLWVGSSKSHLLSS
jgi:hypothetical protein